MSLRTASAAVLLAAGEPVVIHQLDVDDPPPGEVVVRVAASGVCHTDAHVWHHDGWGYEFPILLGHEGAGIVEEVGAAVTHLRPGDRVLMSWRDDHPGTVRLLVSLRLETWAPIRPARRHSSVVRYR